MNIGSSPQNVSWQLEKQEQTVSSNPQQASKTTDAKPTPSNESSQSESSQSSHLENLRQENSVLEGVLSEYDWYMENDLPGMDQLTTAFENPSPLQAQTATLLDHLNTLENPTQNRELSTREEAAQPQVQQPNAPSVALDGVLVNASGLKTVQDSISPELGLGIGFMASNISLVVDLVALGPTIKEYQALNQQISDKTAELANLAQASPENAAAAGNLRKEIEELQTKKSELLKETTTSLGLGTASLTADILGKAGTITSAVAAGTTAATTLMVVGNVAGGLMATLGVGMSLYSLVGDSKERKIMNAEEARLTEKLANTTDPALQKIINLRLNHLQQVSAENKMKTVQHAACFGASTTALGTGVVTGALALSSVSVGTAGAVLLSATGVGAALVGVGLVGTGVAYVAYKNRDVISTACQKNSALIKQKSLSKQIEKHHTVAAASQEAITNTEQKMERVIRLHASNLEQARQQKESLQETHGQVQQNTTLSPQQKQAQVKQLRGRMQEVDQHIVKIEGAFADFMRRATKSKTQLETKRDASTLFIQQETANLAALTDKVKLLQLKKEMAKLTLNFKDMTPESITQEAENLHRLMQSPDSRAEVKTFLSAEGANMQEFEQSPIPTAFKFIVSSPKSAD